MFPAHLNRAFPARTRLAGPDVEVTESSDLVLPFTPASVAVARRRLVSDLIEAGLYGSTISDAALVLSELLSNALRHATPLPGSCLRVACRRALLSSSLRTSAASLIVEP